MRTLLVVATGMELGPLVSTLGPPVKTAGRVSRYRLGSHEIDVLITGVGMVATAVWCARQLAGTRYDLALNVGVCGSFVPRLPPGTVAHVVSDALAELGAEDGDQFLTLQQLGLLAPDEFPFTRGRLMNDAPPSLPALSRLPEAEGITVNTAHGHERSIAAAVARWHPDIESMEGAAFMYACLVQGVPFAQVRAVSNVVERRNRAAWRLGDAVGRLCEVTRAILDLA